jgi:hypothetical protein
VQRHVDGWSEQRAAAIGAASGVSAAAGAAWADIEARANEMKVAKGRRTGRSVVIGVV